ncbi:MAG: T9SS type A sorting domain-containing protein [Fibrobacteria bacterium]|nr:T9SS type A sorting domain-containing protein [Fibrobacteria bacterium]
MKRLATILLISFLSLPISVFSQSFPVTVIHNACEECINIVILADGYTSNELSKFIKDAQNVTNGFFKLSPYSNYKNYINVYGISVPSNISGASMDPDNLIDNYFGSSYWAWGIERLLYSYRTSRIQNVLASSFPTYDQVAILVNHSKDGGSGGDVSTIAVNSESVDVLLHETGHSFVDLIDEYWAGAEHAQEGINMTQVTNRNTVRWKNWYGDNGIGIYPHKESPTWYRPHQNCIMRELENPFCSVCAEATVERIHDMVSPLVAIHDMVPPLGTYRPGYLNITPEQLPLKFSLDLLAPIPYTLDRAWVLNGSSFKKNTDSVSIKRSDLNLGENTLSVSIEDKSPFLRIDNHQSIHTYSVSWTINMSTGITGLSRKTSHLHVDLFPNPAAELINLRINSASEGDIKVDICGLNGRVLKSAVLVDKTVSLSLENIPQGGYIVNFYQNNNLVSSRTIVKK